MEKYPLIIQMEWMRLGTPWRQTCKHYGVDVGGDEYGKAT